MEDAVTITVPSLLAVAARVGTKKNATGLECRGQFMQDSRQLLARDVKQHRVGEDAVEMPARQVQIKKTLLEYLAAAVTSRYGRQLR